MSTKSKIEEIDFMLSLKKVREPKIRFVDYTDLLLPERMNYSDTDEAIKKLRQIALKYNCTIITAKGHKR